MKIKELIEKLEQKSSHQFLKAVSKPEFAFPLPKDLEFFYENYEYAILNIDTYCEIRISSLSELHQQTKFYIQLMMLFGRSWQMISVMIGS